MKLIRYLNILPPFFMDCMKVLIRYFWKVTVYDSPSSKKLEGTNMVTKNENVCLSVEIKKKKNFYISL